MKLKSKGFTLVELLASLVILGMLTLIAAPNIMGILQSSKQTTYIDDAKKLSTTAEYKFRADSSITRPTNGKCIVMTLRYLGTSEFKNPPYGGEYKDTGSFVVIKNANGKYEYYVQLVEEIEEKEVKIFRGIPVVLTSVLSTDNRLDAYSSAIATFTDISSSTTSITLPSGQCSIQERYIG